MISLLEHLTPKHKMTILTPSFNFLWYECSRATAVAIVDRFICDFSKYLESNEETQKLLERYKVADSVDDALHERYVKKMDKEGDGSTPGLFGLHVATIAKLPATFFFNSEDSSASLIEKKKLRRSFVSKSREILF